MLGASQDLDGKSLKFRSNAAGFEFSKIVEVNRLPFDTGQMW